MTTAANDLEHLTDEQLERRAKIEKVLATVAEREKHEAQARLTTTNALATEAAHARNEADPFRNRVYTLSGAVSAASAESAIQQMRGWAAQSSDPITFVINSPGGSVTAGLSLFDTLRELRSNGIDVTTVGTGKVASMGGILLQAGDRRVVHPHTFMLIHEISKISMGKTSSLSDDLELVRNMQAKLVRILSERSTMTEAEIKDQWERKDWWMDAEEIVDRGFADLVGYSG